MYRDYAYRTVTLVTLMFLGVPLICKNKISLTRNNVLANEGRAITTRFFCLQTASKQKRAQTRRSIPNVCKNEC